MDELQLRGVETLPRQARYGFFGAVHRVTQDGVSDVGQMYPDLMGAAGFQPATQMGHAAVSGDDLPVGHGVPSVGHHGHLFPVRPVPAEALLLVNWLVTLEGQQALYDARQIIPLCEGVVDGEGAPVSTETDANATEFLPSVYQESLLKRFQAVVEAVEKRQEAEQDSEQQEQAKEQNP